MDKDIINKKIAHIKMMILLDIMEIKCKWICKDYRKEVSS